MNRDELVDALPLVACGAVDPPLRARVLDELTRHPDLTEELESYVKLHGLLRRNLSGARAPRRASVARVFVAVTPIIMAVLLAAGWRLSQLEPEKPQVIEVHYDRDIERAREIYFEAKREFDAGLRDESPRGIVHLKRAKKLCEDSLAAIDRVREAVGDPEAGKKGETMNFSFESLDQQVAALLIMTRKTILERE